MKLVPCLCALSVGAALSLALGCSHPAPPPPDEAGVHQWMNDFTQAFQSRDSNKVMALYTPDVVAYDLVPPLQYVGKEAYGKDTADFLGQFKANPTLEMRDPHIQISGDLALIECLDHLTGTMNNGQPVDLWVRVTTGLRKVNGKWLDFHDHVSVPTDMVTGKAETSLKP